MIPYNIVVQTSKKRWQVMKYVYTDNNIHFYEKTGPKLNSETEARSICSPGLVEQNSKTDLPEVRKPDCSYCGCAYKNHKYGRCANCGCMNYDMKIKRELPARIQKIKHDHDTPTGTYIAGCPRCDAERKFR